MQKDSSQALGSEIVSSLPYSCVRDISAGGWGVMNVSGIWNKAVMLGDLRGPREDFHTILSTAVPQEAC